MNLRMQAWSIVLAVGLSACAGPTLQIASEPGDARVMIDGERYGVGSVQLAQPYHGTARIDALPARSQPPTPMRHAGHRMVELPAPVTGWLFPFDLLIEIAMNPWLTHEQVVEVRSHPRHVVSPDEEPSTTELRARAMQTLTGR